MANPVKIVKGAAKAMRGKKNSKGLKQSEIADLKKLTTGRAKAATKSGRKIDKQGNIVTKRGAGMVSEARIGKGKNSKANVTDFKSIDKALGNPSKRYLPRSERKGLKSVAEIKAWEKKYYSGTVPVKKKGK